MSDEVREVFQQCFPATEQRHFAFLLFDTEGRGRPGRVVNDGDESGQTANAEDAANDANEGIPRRTGVFAEPRDVDEVIGHHKRDGHAYEGLPEEGPVVFERVVVDEVKIPAEFKEIHKQQDGGDENVFGSGRRHCDNNNYGNNIQSKNGEP